MMEQIGAMGDAIILVHFVYEAVVPPADEEPEGPPNRRMCIACMPNMTEFHQTPYHTNYQRTDAPAAVTCPACKGSSAYKEAIGRNG